ncbi:MAG: chromosome segregation protein SMC [Bdellovibrio sp.]|nr:MAG: chromosome segregation protein SMC [Bdellovibrio sp.]
MRIKKLELLGFKSFKDRTVIHFDKGITGIVGPNGCGKSNIVDALIWVMGEMSAKHLRGSSMEDVIFAGSEDYAPMGFAEVSLTLENDDGPFPAKYSRFSEIMVTRRLHRSGESEYLINKEPARLRDIQEIFMDTGAGSKGFSIIEQGAIGKIITAKPEDRRVLIEEAAGITKFKVRKKESQRKLAATEQNLVRLQDIIGEQKRQLDSLQRQAKRAERYRKLKNKIQKMELWVSATQYKELHEERLDVERKLEELKTQEEASSAKLHQLESELETLKLQMAEKESQVTSRQEEYQKAQEAVRQLETEIRELQFEAEQARRNKEMTGSLLEQYLARQSALKKDLEDLTEKWQQLKDQYQQTEQQLTVKKEKYQQIQERIHRSDEALTQKRREMLTVAQSETHMEAELKGLLSQEEEVKGQVERAQELFTELQSKENEFLRNYKALAKKLESERQLQLEIVRDVENLESNLKIIKEKKEHKLQEVTEFKDRLNEVSSRLYGLENLHSNFEGFQEGVKSIMMWQRQKAELSPDGQVHFQPVAELVEVPAKYELAMEAALGQRLQLLVGESEQEALEALSYLKEKHSGRSSFFVHKASDVAEVPEALLNEDGVDSYLLDVVQVPSDWRQQVAYFLKDIIVVDSLRTALQLRSRYSQYTFVTLDGDTLTPDGVITGGASESAASGVLKRRREIKELSLQREEASGKLALAQEALKKLEAEEKALEKDLGEALKKSTEKEVQLAELKKDVERAETELKNVQQAIESQNKEKNHLQEKWQQLRRKIEELSEAREKAKNQLISLEHEVHSLTEALQSAREGVEHQQEEVTQIQVKLASEGQEIEGVERQKEMLEKSLEEVSRQIQVMQEETEKNKESLSSHQMLIERTQVDLEKMIFEAEEAEKMVALARNEYEEFAASSRSKEEYLSQSLRSLSEFQTQLNETRIHLEQLRMKEQYLLDQIHEKYMVPLQEQYRSILEQGPYVVESGEEQDSSSQQKDPQPEALQEELEDLRRKLSRIGEVNLAAIEEYDELASRYEFLSQQHQDLLEAKEQLKKVIERINRICTRRFKETFDQVNERFMKVFPVLFGGGEARLVLVENEEKGEMGIDIIAKPPGKKLQNVSLLSGGEKALTAVSLIFSIFLVKPSPFCLLDEVDAPLDDANVFRFNDLVREMAKRSQIIVVTHNKHTMKVNNKLFGVTMQEKGVSKMVSVSLDEAVKVAENS